MSERILLSMKWGTAFGADYANVLYGACLRNITGPFRFICLTDEPDGLAPGIEVMPMPHLDMPKEKYFDGAWPKVAYYLEDLHGLKGRALCLDLDVVVWGSLDPLFELEGGYRGMAEGRNWPADGMPDPATLNTSVISFDIGGQTQIVETFLQDQDAAFAQFPNDQTYAEHYARDFHFWPAGWIVSFKRHLRQPILIDRFKPPRRPPSGVKIVSFHGKPRPHQLLPERGQWERFPHYGWGRVDWMHDYWTASLAKAFEARE